MKELRIAKQAAIGLLPLPLLLLMHTQAASGATTTVNINDSTMNVLPSNAFGINDEVYVPVITDPALPPVVQPLGLDIIRWPGGSESDTYHWQTNSITPGQGGYANPSNTFDAFMTMVHQSGIPNVVVTANYGSNAAGTGGGDPNEAAAWVQYANITKGYGVKYWEIGNEVYGNGEYRTSWECDLHIDHSPTAYATNALQYISAMKAVDPTIKIGVVLATPGNFPDGQSPDWNSNVLKVCGSQIDAVIVHWYPQGNTVSDSGLLASTSGVPAMVADVKKLINSYCGANAPNVQIWLTETNSVSSCPGPQTLSIVNALFGTDDYLSWLENGVSNVDWWALHNGPNGTSSSYGDYGILSTGQSPEPPAETPTPSYYGVEMLKEAASAGNTLVTTSSSNSLITAHAVKNANGNMSLVLINKDPSNSYTVTVNVGGISPASTATEYTYNTSTGAIATSTLTGVGTSYNVNIAPYTESAIVMTPGTASTPASPSSLSVLGVDNKTVGLTWNLSPGATFYNILRSTSSAGPFSSVGTAPGTAYTDKSVTNGTTYFYEVSATNSAGTSGNSNQASATPNPIAPPTSCKTSNGPGRVTIMWTQSTTPGVTGNNIYISSSSSGPFGLMKILGPSTSFTAGEPKGVTNYFEVTAVTAVGESAPSNVAAGTAK